MTLALLVLDNQKSCAFIDRFLSIVMSLNVLFRMQKLDFSDSLFGIPHVLIIRNIPFFKQNTAVSNFSHMLSSLIGKFHEPSYPLPNSRNMLFKSFSINQ